MRNLQSKKLIISLLLVVYINIFNPGCTSSPMPGLIFTNTTQHVYAVAASGSQVRSNSIQRMGKSCSVGSWFFLAYFYYGGGGSIEEASQSAGIKKVSVIDRESLSLFYGLYFQECTVVWGE